MDLKGIGVRVWTEFVWLRLGSTGNLLMNMVMNLRVPYKIF